ncbi:hypothetical protein [Rhizobium sp. WYCCWR 11146]|uniref:hypothetical protein n=1 Tax=Rhizobium sp. WYCCWR 11146 TaxID=2749833 RepID=UPI0015E7222F|nr:hypothetical protein [Rhizobium sp. WYCCWR 11146]MBA1344963.1 hypothetical protein [Rhizobium sp. WYCCWR 11146]
MSDNLDDVVRQLFNFLLGDDEAPGDSRLSMLDVNSLSTPTKLRLIALRSLLAKASSNGIGEDQEPLKTWGRQGKAPDLEPLKTWGRQGKVEPLKTWGRQGKAPFKESDVTE